MHAGLATELEERRSFFSPPSLWALDSCHYAAQHTHKMLPGSIHSFGITIPISVGNKETNTNWSNIWFASNPSLSLDFVICRRDGEREREGNWHTGKCFYDKLIQRVVNLNNNLCTYVCFAPFLGHSCGKPNKYFRNSNRSNQWEYGIEERRFEVVKLEGPPATISSQWQ